MGEQERNLPAWFFSYARFPHDWGLGGFFSGFEIRSKLAAVLLGLALGSGGCAARRPAAPPTVYGYADLNVLVRRQPGWSGLAQYDSALARLNASARQLPAAGQPDPKMAVLTALPLASMHSGGLGTADVGEIAQHLSLVQQTLLESLNDRREIARADQLRRQQELWRREARRLFPVPARTAEISSDLRLQLLQANVISLTRTLDYWNASKPPAPRLDRLRLKVEADRSRLPSADRVPSSSPRRRAGGPRGSHSASASGADGTMRRHRARC